MPTLSTISLNNDVLCFPNAPAYFMYISLYAKPLDYQIISYISYALPSCSQHFGNELFTKLMRYDAATAKLVEEDYASVPALEVFKDDV